MASRSHEIALEIAALEDRTRHAPRDVDAWGKLVRSWIHLGHCDQASRCLDRLIACEPTAAPTLIARAELAQAEENLATAVLCAERAVTAAPRSAEAHSCLASMLSSDGDLERATVEYRQAIALQPDDIVRMLHLAAILSSRSLFEEALDLQAQAMEAAMARDDREALEACVIHSSSAYRERTPAEFASLNRRLALAPTHLALQLHWLVCALDPDCRPSVSDSREKALNFVSELVRTRPDLPGLPEVLGDTFAIKSARAGIRRTARMAFREVLAHRSKEPRVVANAAEFFFDTERNAEAAHWIEAARGLEPDESRWPTMHAAILLGNSEAEGRRERVLAAIPDLEHAAALERTRAGESPELAVALAYAYFTVGRLDDASTWLASARASAAPRWAHDVQEAMHVECTLEGLIHFGRGHPEAARAALLRSVSLPKPSQFDPFVSIQTELAEALLRAGERNAVIEFLRGVIRVSHELEWEQWTTEIKVVERGAVPIGWGPMSTPFTSLGRR